MLTYYALIMSCVSGDEVCIKIARREDIFNWLKKLDHEGSAWVVFYHEDIGSSPYSNDITAEIMREYQQ